MEKVKNKYFHVSYDKETIDTQRLAEIIKESKWLQPDTVLINCSPDYSSRLVQGLNHGLSHLNFNELFQVIPLEIPTPNMSQVWSNQDKGYVQFEKYLLDWVRFNLDSAYNYLVVCSDFLEDKALSRVRSNMRTKLGFEQFRFAGLYVQDSAPFTPDYYVQLFNKESQGGILYQWENIDNNNW